MRAGALLPPPQRVLLAALLLGIALSLPFASSQQQQRPTIAGVPSKGNAIYPRMLTTAAGNGTVKITRQQTQLTDKWTDNVRCLALYMDSPAWMHYDITLDLQVKNDTPDGKLQQCLQNSVRWQVVVVGADYHPRDLAVAVGYTEPPGLGLESTFNMDAQLSFQDAPETLPILDYDEDPTVPDTSQVKDDVLFQKVGQCYATYKWDTSAQRDQLGNLIPGLNTPTTVEAKQKLEDCLSNITIEGLPPAPPPPPSPPPGPIKSQKGKVRRTFAELRRLFNLAPFLRQPVAFNGTKSPYDKRGNLDDSITTFQNYYQTYVMPEDTCIDPFLNDEEFTTLQLGEKKVFDSCYYSQMILYIYYNGSCLQQANADPATSRFWLDITATATASYSDYDKCGKTVIQIMAKVIYWVLLVTAIPAGLFLLFLVWPTIWRLLYRGVLVLRMLCMGKDRKRKAKLRMQMDAPLRWAWLLRFKARPWVRNIILVRKRLLYSCLTMQNINGRNRLVMVAILASVTTFVSIMVWQPSIRIVLNSNPNKVTLQLDKVTGPYGKLARYFQIVGASLFMGCMAYMSLLTNANMPSEDDARRYVSKMLKKRNQHGGSGLQAKLRGSDPGGVEMPSASHPVGTNDVMLDKFAKQGVEAGGSPWLQHRGPAAHPTGQAVMAYAGVPMVMNMPDAGRKVGSLEQWSANLKLKSDQWTSWEIQKIITLCFTAYLAFLLIVQNINVLYLIGITNVRAAYVWIVIIQFINIALVVIVQFWDLSTIEYDAVVKYLGYDAPPPEGLTRIMIKLRSWAIGADKKRLQAAKKPDIETQGSSAKAGDPKAPVNGSSPSAAVDADKAKADKKKKRKKKNRLLRLWRGDESAQDQVPGLTKREIRKRRRAREDAEPQYSIWRQLVIIYNEALGEEWEIIRWGDTEIRARTFKYPSWFLASILTAMYMLIFHFIKSLDFADKLSYCVISWSECEISWIRNFANTYNLQQLGVVRSAAIRLRRMLDSLDPVEQIFNRIVWGIGINTSLGQLKGTLTNVDIWATEGNSARAVWVEEFGDRMSQTSAIGYSLGLALGFLTLLIAMVSFKRIAKAHRLLLLTRRLLAAQQGSHEDSDDEGGLVDAQLGKLRMMRVAAAGGKSLTRTLNGTEAMRLSREASYTQGALEGSPPMVKGRFKGLVAEPTSPTKAFPLKDDDDDEDFPGLGSPRDELGTKRSRSSRKASSDTDSGSDSDEEVKEPEAFNVATIAAFRAFNVPISQVVFFLGVLLSSTVVQLYTVGIVLSAIFAYVLSDYFWTTIAAKYWPYVFMAVVVIILNKTVLASLIGSRYVSDGKRIKRPAGWFAYMVIASITNLIIGLFIAVLRLVWLVLSSIFTVGLLDRTIMAIGAKADQSYNSFLAGIHLRDGVGLVDVRAFKPGPLWRSTRRWRAAIKAVIKLGPKGFEELVARNQAAAAKKPPALSGSGVPPQPPHQPPPGAGGFGAPTGGHAASQPGSGQGYPPNFAQAPPGAYHAQPQVVSPQPQAHQQRFSSPPQPTYQQQQQPQQHHAAYGQQQQQPQQQWAQDYPQTGLGPGPLQRAQQRGSSPGYGSAAVTPSYAAAPPAAQDAARWGAQTDAQHTPSGSYPSGSGPSASAGSEYPLIGQGGRWRGNM